LPLPSQTIALPVPIDFRHAPARYPFKRVDDPNFPTSSIKAIQAFFKVQTRIDQITLPKCYTTQMAKSPGDIAGLFG